MALALNAPHPTSGTVAAVCWGRLSAIVATLVFDVVLIWSVARAFA